MDIVVRHSKSNQINLWTRVRRLAAANDSTFVTVWKGAQYGVPNTVIPIKLGQHITQRLVKDVAKWGSNPF